MAAQSLRYAAVLLAIMLSSPAVFAQPGRPGRAPAPPFPQPNRPFQPGQTGADDTTATCAACGGMAAFFIVLGVVSLVSMIIWIFVAIWVANNAKARGMDNSALWVVLTIFLGLIGLVIYLVSRPQGELKLCRECGKKRLREARRCPHCRAA